MFFLNNKFSIIFIFLFLFTFSVKSNEIINKIEVFGNERISTDTIKLFTKISINDKINNEIINEITKNLYQTNFFDFIEIKFENSILIINVNEKPIIENLIINGIKANKIRESFINLLNLKNRSSFDEYFLDKDKEIILFALKNLGYYSAKVDVFIEDLEDKKVNLIYNIELGEKAKIKKITFVGNKVFKDSKLRSLIVSEEYKFWKIVSGKKYLNENLIELDKRLLKNFYLNNGYYSVDIRSSQAKMVDINEFELIFNIDAKEKFFFGDLILDLPNSYDLSNFKNINKTFAEIKNSPYSINTVDKILNKLEFISISEQFESISASVIEDVDDQVVNIKFIIEDTAPILIQKINIYGNNITRENVIRNQFEIDEGDPFNELLAKKTENNLKNLNYFEDVKLEVIDGSLENTKIINISVKEKATGQISAGAGFGTSGATVVFGIKENNYLGKGINVDTNLNINEQSIKGSFEVINPNFNNTDKSMYGRIEATETDRLSNFGYKSNKLGFSIGTNFELFDDLNLGLSTSSYVEKMETSSTASSLLKKQEGSYFDTFLKADFKYDKRNQKYKTTDGFISNYSIDLPLLSETYTLTNSYNYKFFTELYDKNISTFSVLLQSAFSITNKNAKLSERLFIPSSRLRGFEAGKVGPKDADDFIGGNNLFAMNFTSSLPQILENSQNIDFTLFLDVANIWGVDYIDTINNNGKIRSSFGLGVDWFTPVGPLNFSISQPILKEDTDVTESVRFNIGTTF